MGCDSFLVFCRFSLHEEFDFLGQVAQSSGTRSPIYRLISSLLRCVLHSCSAYDTCLDKLGIQCNFHDLGGQSRFFEWLGWSVKGHTVEWRQTLTLVFVPSPSSMRKCKVFYGKCQTQCLAHMQRAVISKWALDRGEPPPHTHTHWDTHSVIMPIVFLSCCTERKNLHLSHAVLLTSYLIFFLAYSLSDPVWPYIHKHL